MKTTHRLVFNHEILLNRSPGTHIGYRNDVRQDESWDRLLDTIAAGHCRLFQMIPVVWIVDLVDELAVDAFHPLQHVIGDGLAFFPSRQNKAKE